MTLLEEIRDIISRLLDILQFTGSWTETIINVTLLLTAIYTFIFLVYIPILYPLRRLFKPMGIPMSEASLIAWKCRRQPALFLRYYIETVIINGSTTHMPRSRWRELRRIFEAELTEYDQQKSFTVHSSSVSDIISEEKKELISRYFDLCTRKSRRTLNDFLWQRHLRRNPDFKPDVFSSELSISNGFLAPMARITGLNDRFEQNWQSIINNYLHMVSNSAGTIPSAAASLTYTWLMWGPSVQIRPGAQSAASPKSLGIYGCGDEANSVHVIIPSYILEKKFSDSSSCKECTIIGRLHNPLYYIKTARSEFDPLSCTFLDRIHYSYQSTSEYIIEIRKLNSAERESAPKRPGYFTAYIWAMFNLQPDASARAEFRPANTVVLFEHANLADTGNYNFLCESLLAKIRGFFQRFPAQPNERYLYCCAMNGDLDSRIRRLLTDNPPKNVAIGDFGIPDILETLDAHFNIVKLQIIPPQRYADVVRFHYALRQDNGLQELCTLLADPQTLVVGSEDEKRELNAVGILCAGQTQLACTILSPRSTIAASDLEEFARHARLIHGREQPGQQEIQ